MNAFAVEQVPVGCPYCGEPVELPVDAPPGRHELVEDCPVCCRPMQVVVEVGADGSVNVTVKHEDDA